MVTQRGDLRSLRESRGLTLEAMAYLAGVDAATISRIERGKVEPERGTVVKLARSLGLSVSRLRALIAEGAVAVGDQD